jgi:micrococcal nuclease
MKKPDLDIYHYRAKILKNYDGDTLTAELDLGLHIKATRKIRLSRINTPEVRGVEKVAGKIAKQALQGYFISNWDQPIEITTILDKEGKFGRLLGELWCGEVNVNDWLVRNGFAVYKEY